LTEPNGRDDRETLDTAQGLTVALDNMAAEVKRLRTYGRRNRRFIIFDIAATVALTVAMFIAVGASQSAHDASVAAAQNRNSALISCQATNVAREQNAQLWAYILTLFTPRPGETAAQKTQGEKVLAELRDKVDTTFAPRNCTALLQQGNQG
jgi:hypothetical protein